MAEYDEFEEFEDVDIELFFGENIDDSEGNNSATTSQGEANDGNVAGPSSTSVSRPTAKPKQSNRKKAIPRPASTYTLQIALNGKDELLQDTVTAVGGYDIVCESSLPLSPPVKQFVDTCQESFQREGANLQVALQHFAALLTLIWPTIAVAERHSMSSDRRGASLSAFFLVRNGDAMWEKANETFKALAGIDIPHMFIQIFARLLHEKLLKEHERIPAASTENPVAELNRQEQNALRYTAGYIVGRLTRKILRQNEKEQMQNVLDNMKKGSDKETRLSYTREWVETQSRGGLVMINDSTFLFFEKIEKLVRQHFPKTTHELRGRDLREGITGKALQNRTLLEKWTLLTAHSHLTEAGSLTLFQLLICFYTQVRGFSFAKNINERCKIFNKKQGKRSKGVRSTLKRSEQESADK